MRDTSNHDLISLIFTATSIIRKHTAGTVAPVSLVQLKVLSVLAAHESLTMREIADTLYIAPPSATALVNHLIAERAAVRFIDHRDRRLVRLKITPKGAGLLEKRLAEISGIMNEVLGTLNAKEKNSLTHILRKIIHSYR